MSHGRGDFNYGSISRSDYQTLPQTADYRGGASVDANYKALCDRISGNIFTIGANVSSIEQAVRQVGTNKDSVQLREKLHSIEQKTNAIISETTTALRQLSTLCSRTTSDSNRPYRLQSQRLMGEFKDVTQRYNVMQKKAAEKVKSTNLPSTGSSQHHVPTGDLLGWSDVGDEERLIQQQERQRQLVAEEQSIDLEVALLQEREHQIRQLEGDILDINQIFRDLGMLVHEQGETIDTIEANVTTAHDSVEQGREQLQKAARYQMKSRKKMCCLVAILLVVIAVIVVIIVVAVKVK